MARISTVMQEHKYWLILLLIKQNNASLTESALESSGVGGWKWRSRHYVERNISCTESPLSVLEVKGKVVPLHVLIVLGGTEV